MAISGERLASQRPRPIEYPTSDGRPMGETDKHVDLSMNSKEALLVRYADRPEVYVASNNLLFYEEGNPKAFISPDCYVVFGVGMRQRDSYKVWEEGGIVPAIVFEFTSKKTRREDLSKKFRLYETVLRVPEYVLFDPTHDYLKPPLKGYRLEAGKYVAIEPNPEDGRLYSATLELEILSEGTRLRFYDPQTKEFLLTPLEQARRANLEAQRAEAARRRAEAEAQKARNEAQRAEAEAQRADAETIARHAAEAEVERLRAEIERLRKQPGNS